ncbi:hypothetical protein QYM36_010270 [Artemia franciscana]|uniref:Peptidase A2 domain-containing protein n=1 Tax=Artemia franciscana TaxID=6661 RepID=A0AA88I5G4_ARTSF|nr:hypothetical protein QYM36_010270 [Artemia franciscana]
MKQVENAHLALIQTKNQTYLYAVNQDQGKDEAIATITINGQTRVDFNIDTGAQGNLIPKHYLDMLSPNSVLETTRHKLTSYYGSQIPSLGTYHHSLETILSKLLQNAPARMQRLMIQIQPYDLSVPYSPSPDIPVAEALSCLHLPDINEELHPDI